MDYKVLQEQDKIVSELKEKEAEAKATLELTQTYKDWKEISKQLSLEKSILDTLEDQYKYEGSVKYAKSKEIEPVPFVKIKMYTKLKYNDNKLIKYFIGIDKYDAVDLNKKVADKYLIECLDKDTLPSDLGVVSYKEPKPTLQKSKLYTKD